jgi:hypothetical protein
MNCFTHYSVKSLLKTLLVIAVLGVASATVKAQSITNYAFSAPSGTFTAISGGTSPNLSNGTWDDGYINNLSIGFDFFYMGSVYSAVCPSTNGWMRLGTGGMSAASGNDLSSGGTRPLLAPLWDDLKLPTNGLTYLTTGTAPNRVFTMQWLNARWNYSAPAACISFQVKLYETTGAIEYIYRQESSAVVLGSASIGMTATAGGSGNFYSLDAVSNSASVSSTTETSTLNSKPATGQIFSFTPSIPTAASDLQITSITSTTMNLTWTDNSSDETGFAVYRSIDDGATYSYLAMVAANTTTYSASGLTGGSSYYWKLFAITEGGVATTDTVNDYTSSPAVVTAVVNNGAWGTTSTWSPARVPLATDSVVIPAGIRVRETTTTARCLHLVVDGTLTLGTSTTVTLTVGKTVVVNTGGFIGNDSATTGAKNLNIGGQNSGTYGPGSLLVDGTFNMDQGTNRQIAINFYGNNNATITGSGTTCNFYTLRVNKGTSTLRTLDVQRVITIASPTTTGQTLTITTGNFKLSSASTLTPYYKAATITATNGKLTLNNASASIGVVSPGTVTTDGDATVAGTLQIEDGTFHYGGGDSRLYITGTLNINGGTLNEYGRVHINDLGRWTQTGGIINLDPQSASNLKQNHVFHAEDQTYINVTGGTVAIIDPNVLNTSTTYREFNLEGHVAGYDKDLSGLTIKTGNGSSNSAGTSSTGGFCIYIPAGFPIRNITCNNPTGSYRATLLINALTADTVTNTAGTLDLNGKQLTSNYAFTCTGVFKASATGSHLYIGGTAAQTLAGTIISNTIDKLTLNNAGGLSISAGTVILGSAVTLNSGALSFGGTLTLGLAGTTGFDYANAGGSFSGTPSRNYGTGNLNFTYNGSSAQGTGNELPDSAIGTSSTFTVNNAAGVTLNKAYKTYLATFTAGALTTTSTNLLTIKGAAATAVTRTSGYVKGPLKRAIANNLSGVSVIFPVGKGIDNTLQFTNLTTGGTTGYWTAEAFDANSGGTAGTGLVSIHTNRYWNVSVSAGSATTTITSGNILTTDTGLASSNAIGRSATVNGAYANIGGGYIGSSITSSNNTNLGYFIIGDKASLAGGTYTTGTGRAYANLTAVAADLNSKTLTGNVIIKLSKDYTGTAGETFPITFYEWGSTGGPWNVTIMVQDTIITARTTSGTPATGTSLIVLSGCDRLTLDGRAGGTGSTILWNIRNTRTAATVGSAITVSNDASYNTLRYLNIEAQTASTTNGIINFSTTSATNGNDSNIIEYNTIKEYASGAGQPIVGIYAQGTLGKENDYNIIRNNQISNAKNDGISLASCGNGWTINNNSIFYNFATLSTVSQNGIKVLAGYGHTISGNNIGGTATNLGGSNWQNNGVGATFNGIYATPGTTLATNIYSNNIGKIYMADNSTVNFNGIYTSGGLLNIGTSGGNTIGHASTADAITLAGTSGTFDGILVASSITNSNVENNIIANVTANSSSGSYTLEGVNVNGANVRKNKIYSLGASSSFLYPVVNGIYFSNANGSTYEVSNNMVSLNGGSSSNPSIYGFYGTSPAACLTKVYYNTFHIYGGVTGTNTYAFYRNTASTYNMVNNIFYNNRDTSGAGVNVAYANGYATPATGWAISDYNVIKSARSSTTAQWASSPVSLSSLQSLSGMDANSFAYTPVFKTSTDLHLDTNYNCGINGKGGVIAVTTDLDGQTRNGSKPDIGFDELPYMPLGSWFGYSNTNWNNAANWCNLVVPDTTYDVTIDPSASNQPAISASFDCHDLTVNAAATLTISSGSINVYGDLAASGTISTGSNYIAMRGNEAQTFNKASISNLRINKTGSNVTLSNPATISTNLDMLNGNISLGNNDLTMSTGATITNASAASYISTVDVAAAGGYLIQNVDNASTPVMYHVGTTTYTPARVLNAGSSSGSFRVRAFNGVLESGTYGAALSNVSHAVNRTWLVENVSAGTYDVTVRLQWNSADENASFVRTWCGIGHYHSSTWNAGAPSASSAGTEANSYYQELNNLSSFSPFSVGDKFSPLPVKMVSFNAQAIGNDVNVKWTTATELNSDRFEIERSLDGKNWVKVGEQAAKGNSNSIVNYNYSDMNAHNLSNTIYYRLRQVDLNGQFEYTSVALVNFAKGAAIQVNFIQPNPFNETVNIGLNLNQDELVTVKIVDMSGKEVVVKNFNLTKNDHSISLNDLQQVSKGMYMIYVIAGNENIITRVMKTE